MTNEQASITEQSITEQSPNEHSLNENPLMTDSSMNSSQSTLVQLQIMVQLPGYRPATFPQPGQEK